MNTTELFLAAMLLIFSVPYLIWRLGRTEYFAPLVVVQIITGILLGPGVLGAAVPEYYAFVFTPTLVLPAQAGWVRHEARAQSTLARSSRALHSFALPEVPCPPPHLPPSRPRREPRAMTGA